MKRIKSLLAASIATVMLAACASQHTAPAAAPTSIVGHPHFAATSSQLTARLKLQNLGESRDNDLLRFQAVLINDWHADVKFRYQVLWYDDNNMLIGPESRPWHAVTLRSGSVHAIEATAPRVSASRYVIQLQDQ